MRKRIIQVLSVVLGVVVFNLIGCQPSNEQSLQQIPSHPIQKGISAPFAGFVGQWMLVGGGCNFPNTPAAEGGKKVFYADVVACNVNSDSLQWLPGQNFPFPIAYGASVETEEGLICIGGVNEQTALKSVFRLKINPETAKVSIETLPSLPETIDNAAATYFDQQLFVTGGNQGNGGQSLYTLHLKTDTAWTKLADYPGAKRIQPVLLAADDALFLFGGFEVNANTKESTVSSDFIVYSIKDNRWGEPQEIPTMKNGGQRALVGAAGVHVGSRLFLAGGVNYEIFKAAVEGKAPADYMKRPAEWYQFSKDLLIYDLQTKDWKVVTDVEGFNKAGGSLLHHDGSLYMVCGEIKPGIRTNEIVKKDLKELLSEEEGKK